jgi:hypothetical protein
VGAPSHDRTPEGVPDAAPGPVPDPVELAPPAAPLPVEEEGPPTAGPLAHLVAALVVVALGVATVVASWGLGAGSAQEPDAGTWPLVLGVLVTVLGVALVVGARRTHDAEAFTRHSTGVVLGVATMVAFALLVGRIGFEIPGVLLCLVWMRVLGREGWRTSVVASLAVVAAFYAIFVGALSVPVPHLF